jgi:Aminoglycoside-2''-adenylyltransferase
MRQTMSCDLRALFDALSYLQSHSMRTWVFGGWAEELRCLRAPGRHHDIDLLYPSESFKSIDALIKRDNIKEITEKRSAHKRAIVLDDGMVELFLLRRDHLGPHTLFWGRHRHDWPDGVLSRVADLPVASTAALRSYRAAHRQIHGTSTASMYAIEQTA